MGKGTKVVAHEVTGSGTYIFYKRWYGKGHCSTLPIWYPLPSLNQGLLKIVDKVRVGQNGKRQLKQN